MTRQDEERFIEFVKGTGNISVLPYESPTAEFSNVKTLAEPFSVPSWSFLWLYNRDIKPEPITEYVPQQKYYEVERFRSPVIEFSRSFVKENSMRPGRIWAEFQYLDEETRSLVQKDPKFRQWFSQLANWIRKNYEHVDRMVYAGPGAQAFRAGGGKLQVNR